MPPAVDKSLGTTFYVGTRVQPREKVEGFRSEDSRPKVISMLERGP